MTIRSIKDKPVELSIDLTGENGNAYVLLGQAKSFLRQLGREDEIEKIIEEMVSGNYENLVEVFEREFSYFCVLYR